MEETTVISFEPLHIDQNGDPFWYKIVFEDTESPFALHRNWVATNGELKQGDKVQYVKSKASLHGHALFDKIQKLELAS